MPDTKQEKLVSNRVLVCDDDASLLEEYRRCFSTDFVADVATA